jgi:hypothetical protein
VTGQLTNDEDGLSDLLPQLCKAAAPLQNSDAVPPSLANLKNDDHHHTHWWSKSVKRGDDQGRKPGQLSTEDTGTARTRVAQRRGGAGFDPYQGTFSSQPPRRKMDLRKLEEWLEAKRLAEESKRQQAAFAAGSDQEPEGQ